jgi:hypothetical protein
MATSTQLTGPQLRALRVLGEHGDVPEMGHTEESVPCVSGADADVLGRWHLADRTIVTAGPSVWRIRAKGRQVLREHDAEQAQADEQNDALRHSPGPPRPDGLNFSAPYDDARWKDQP